MTTIVAVQTEDDVLLAWDSQMTRDNEKTPSHEPKVWIRQGVVFGVSGHARLIDLVYAMEFPEYDGSEARMWIIRQLVPAIQQVIEDSPNSEAVTGKDGDVRGGILVVVDGTAFLLDSLLSPLSSVRGHYAMGSGGDYAHGALEAGLSPAAAVAVAAEIDPFTGGKINVSTYSELVLSEG